MQCWAGSLVPWEGALLHLLAVHLDVCDVVLKDGGHVDLWELVLAEDDEEAGLPTGPVAHNHQLLSDRSHGWGCQGRGSAGLGRGLVSPKAFLWPPQDLPGSRSIQQKEGKGLAQACSCQEPTAWATWLEIPYLRVRDRSPPPHGLEHRSGRWKTQPRGSQTT